MTLQNVSENPAGTLRRKRMCNKKMKRLLSVGLALFLMAGLVGCSSGSDEPKDTKTSTEAPSEEEDTEEEAKPYERGTIDGNHFESAWLNIQADFSDQYVMLTEEEIAQAQSTGSELILNEDGQETLEETDTTGYEMMVSGLNGVPNCTLGVEKLPLSNMTAAQYLEAAKQNFEQMSSADVEITALDEVPTVAIAGQDYQCLQLLVNTQGVQVNSNTYVRIQDGYAVLFNVTFTDDTAAQKDELLATFQVIE